MAAGAAEQDLPGLLLSLPDGVILTDGNSRFVWVNAVAERQLGLSPSEWEGKTIESLVQARPDLAWIFEEQPAEILRCWEALNCQEENCFLWGQPLTLCWSSQKSCPTCPRPAGPVGQGAPLSGVCSRCSVFKTHIHVREKEIVRAAEDRIVLQVTTAPAPTEPDKPVGRLRILRDVTQELEVSRVKNEFLSALSHELRTPLTSIRSYAEILTKYKDTDPADQKRFLDIILSESERLDQIIDDMTELRRLDVTRSVWNNRSLELQEVIESVLQDQKRLLEAKDLDCQVELDPSCPRIWADFDRIQRVLSTLIRNLAKRTARGGTILLKGSAVQGRRETDRASLLRLSLVGIDPADRTAPAEKDRASESRDRGLGLGLLLCKHILEPYGGKLWTDSGNGRSIHLMLPASGSEAGRKEMEETLHQEAAPTARGPIRIQKTKKSILVVDDDPSILSAISFALTKEGYNVHSSTSAKRALEIVRTEKPELIISDITMPEMDGYAFLQELKKDEAAKMIPFIFISAKGDTTDRIKGLKTGVDDYLSKPFEIKELAARVEALLARVDRLKDLSRFDGLTGALTRRAFEEVLPQELRKAQLNGQPLALAMADLDHFKRINDTHGHLAGDFVLASFVRFLKRNLRDDAILVRYGGEEFCVVMPDVRKRVAWEILERIRKMLSETSFRYEKENLEIRVTCSFGVSGFPEDGANTEGLISKSDEALYAAKSLGRNRVVLYGEASPSPTTGRRSSTSGNG